MIEIDLAELRQDDVGSRVVVLHDGGTIEGRLDSAWTAWDAYAKPQPGPRCRVVVVEGNVKAEIAKLPMDFRIQIERAPQSPDLETGEQ